MVNARNALQSARGELQVAERDKGGYRVNALKCTRGLLRGLRGPLPPTPFRKGRGRMLWMLYAVAVVKNFRLPLDCRATRKPITARLAILKNTPTPNAGA